MDNVQTYRVLLVDDDSTIRRNLKIYLTDYHQGENYQLEVTEAATAEGAIEYLQQSPFDLLICDINLPDNDGFYVIQYTQEHHPKTKHALITAYDLETYIEMAKTQGVYNIIIKAAPFNFQELSITVDNLLCPEKAFGLDRYLENHQEAFTEITLTKSTDIMPACETLKTYLQNFAIDEVDALYIVMVEAITNAVYHSAKNADGSLRYQKGDVIDELAPHEYVTITYGADSEKIGVAIKDQGGTMRADEVLYWLNRNISGENLLDTHGRGIYLIHQLVHRVVLNLAKEQCTELILLHYFNDPPPDNKPLYINEVT